MDHPTWRSSTAKSYRVHLNFNGGEALFYIPPGNFHGEIQDYNFLVSKDKFDMAAKTGKISWETSKFTVVNPNKTFSKYVPSVDTYIRGACKDRNIAIEENLVLVEVQPVNIKKYRMITLPCLEIRLLVNLSQEDTDFSTVLCLPPLMPT